MNNRINPTLFAIVAIIAILCGCKREEVVRVDYVPTPGETLVVESPVNESGTICHKIECYPNEVYFGDTLYLASFVENISAEENVEVPDCLSAMRFWNDGWTVSISSPQLNGVYEFRKEMPEQQTSMLDIIKVLKNVSPGEKRVLKYVCLDSPPLEDMELPFWKELRESLPSEGLVCHIKVEETYEVYCNGDDQYKKASAEFAVLVKPRPQGEMELLDRWRANTPKDSFPVASKVFKFPSGAELKSSGRSDIKIRGRKYDPWAFIRVGNRKPSDPNNPTTLDGWRRLEASLTPSTMRDEIRFTRLRLEYYSAKDGEESQKSSQEYSGWFESLPEIQRHIMANYCYYSPKTKFSKTLDDRDQIFKRWKTQADPYRLD